MHVHTLFKIYVWIKKKEMLEFKSILPHDIFRAIKIFPFSRSFETRLTLRRGDLLYLGKLNWIEERNYHASNERFSKLDNYSKKMRDSRWRDFPPCCFPGIKEFNAPPRRNKGGGGCVLGEELNGVKLGFACFKNSLARFGKKWNYDSPWTIPVGERSKLHL